MEDLSRLQERIASLRESVRLRPGMYFGRGGSLAIPFMLNDLATGILRDVEPGRRVRLSIKFDEAADGTIAFCVDGAVCRTALLPHSFVAALHVQHPRPSFYAPTKDILMGDEVRDFVCEVASAALPAQWEALRRQRDATLSPG